MSFGRTATFAFLILLSVAVLAVGSLRVTQVGNMSGVSPAGRGAGDPVPNAIRVEREAQLPLSLRWAMDVRWASDTSLLIAAGQEGVVQTNLAGVVSRVRIPGGGTPGAKGAASLWLATRVGISEQLLAGAAPAFVLVLKAMQGEADGVIRPYAAVLDVDVQGSTALVLGAQRDESGQWAPDGAMAWLDDGRSDPKPVHFARSRAESDAVSRCGLLDIGAVRFLHDGSFVIAPGVQPGVFLYGENGVLEHVWQTTELGVFGGCPYSQEQSREFSAAPEPRWTIWNNSVLVDDIVEVGGAPALLVRRRQGDTTRWSMVILSIAGENRTVPLPFTSSSGLSRARADVRGDDMVLLIHESGRMDVPPQSTPRLLFLGVSK